MCKNFHTENYKTFLREIKNDLGKCRDIKNSCSYIIKSIFPTSTYKFSKIPIISQNRFVYMCV